MALLIGFALDQQVPVPTAFTGPLKLKQRIGTLDPGRIATTDPATLEEAFREKPAIHRFPGAMAAPRAGAERASSTSATAARPSGSGPRPRDADELRQRIEELPGFGEMKIKALGSVLAKRFGVAAAQGLVPTTPRSATSTRRRRWSATRPPSAPTRPR